MYPPILLKRSCQGIRIPSGETVILEPGIEVSIIQNLGGSFTVRTDGDVLRIAPEDADALGFAPQESPGSTGQTGDSNEEKTSVEETEVWDALKTCFDPEIPVNIVDLGLVYDLKIEPGEHASRVTVQMTLTAAGCGMGPTIAGDAQCKILNLAGVEFAQVDVIWDPPWDKSMITAAGREILGL
jgi:probable FeS assembly SUF system protein SufT